LRGFDFFENPWHSFFSYFIKGLLFMPMDLSFTIDQEFYAGELFFIVLITEKGSRKIVYLSDLRDFKKVEPELVVLLLKERVSSDRSDTANVSKVRIKGSSALPVLQKLISSKRLLWKGRSLFFNPLSKAELILTAESLGPEGISLSASVFLDGKETPFSAIDFLFLSKGAFFGIARQVVFFFPKGSYFPCLEGLYPGGKVLEGKARERFLLDYEEDPPEGFPKIIWEGAFLPEEEKLLEPLPRLLLKDTYGAFADLEMNYEGRFVSFLSVQDFSGRNKEAEKGWEKDLLETGFIRKVFPNSSYYCPTDQVAKSLSFLLDLGWEICDREQRRLLRLSNSSLMATKVKETVHLEGSFDYEGHTAALSDVVGAFSRRDKFLELSDNTVAWLGENEKGYEGIEELTVCSRSETGCSLQKKHLGLLEGLSMIKDKEVSKLLQKGEGCAQDLLFQAKLHPYQEEGKKWLTFLAQSGFSGLLADEMGLGKTVQTLSFLSQHTFNKPVLLVVPTSLVFNWKKEWETFLPHKDLYVHEGKNRFSGGDLEEKGVILTSYALLRIDHVLFSQISFAMVILDEAQWIKNPDSQLAKVAYSLQADMRLCLTGTPIENRGDDLWSLFHFLDKDLLGDRQGFLAKLQSAAVDDRYRKQIRKIVHPFILRRMKTEVAQDLPEKIEQVIYVEMEEGQQRLYEEWVSKTRQGVLKKVSLEGANSHRMEVLEAILRLRQICCHPTLVDGETAAGSAKLERVMLDLEEAVSQGRKVLIYSQFTQMLRLIEKEIQSRKIRYVYLDGSTKDREGVVSAFQEDPDIKVFLISLKAGGVGLNLTAADYVFLFDPWWNEAVERQAIDRVHRFGRKNTVVARRYVMAMSVEEKMLKLKAHKISLAKGLLDFQAGGPGLSDMLELLTHQTEDRPAL
jgi:superfamily II DNA or RNA helicase